MIRRRAVARERAREAAALVVEEAGRLPEDARGAYWDELIKMLPLPVAAAAPADDPPFDDHQSKCWGRTKMPWGKYQGECVDDVPIEYLEKLCDPQPFIRSLKRYLSSRRIMLERESGNYED